MSDICQVILKCSLGAANCSVSQNGVISNEIKSSVSGTSGLAATLLDGTSVIRVYYRGAGRAVRALGGNGPATNGWQDICVGTQSITGSGIVVDFNSNNDTIQVVWVSSVSKELQEINYSDATGVSDVTGKGSLLTHSAFLSANDRRRNKSPWSCLHGFNGWSAKAKFSTCFQPGFDQHHIYYVGSSGQIFGIWRRDFNNIWNPTHVSSWGTAVGGIASVTSANNAGDWSDVQTC